MLTAQQKNHFEAFGYLFLQQAFSCEEMEIITRTIERDWAENPPPIQGEEQRASGVVERWPELAGLVTDERIYPVIEGLLGRDLLWVGSEGNASGKPAVVWHPDRKYYLDGEQGWIDFRQIKVMIYLDPVDRDSGCLRVIPGSHRMPFHADLAAQELDPGALPFGLEGTELPCVPLTSRPGDVIFFNHMLWHAAFGGGPRRRYLALKFTQRPTATHHIDSLRKYSAAAFAPADSFTNHDDARIRALARIPSVAAGR